MDIVNLIFFIIISLVAIISALAVVFAPGIIYSVASLIISFFAVAGIFILLNADFVGISQIIIYGVGISIILVFAIMLTAKESDKKLWIAFAPRTLFALIIAFSFVALISFSVTGGFKSSSENAGIFNVKSPSVATVELLKTKGTSETIGKALFTNYLFPFELLSLLLLAAILGAGVIAKKNKDKLVNPTTCLQKNDSSERG